MLSQVGEVRDHKGQLGVYNVLVGSGVLILFNRICVLLDGSIQYFLTVVKKEKKKNMPDDVL